MNVYAITEREEGREYPFGSIEGLLDQAFKTKRLATERLHRIEEERRLAGLCEKGFRLEVVGLSVPAGRIDFDDGHATVCWPYVLCKDLANINVDLQEWVNRFYAAHERSYATNETVESLCKVCDWWRFASERLPDHFDAGLFGAACPEFLERPECSHIRVGQDDWVSILLDRPEIADRELHGRSICWESFTGDDWTRLICGHLSFLNRCDHRLLSSSNWARILVGHPELAGEYKDWNSFSDDDWSVLLSTCPQFVRYCDLEKFGQMWSPAVYNLLQKQPGLVGVVNRTSISGDEWFCLLGEYRLMLKFCNWARLSFGNLLQLAERCPEYKSYCDWSQLSFSGRDLARFLTVAPEWRDKYCGSKVMNEACVSELSEAALSEALKNGWSLEDASLWSLVLSKGSMNDELCEWKTLQLTHYQWRDLLKARPELIEKCPIDILTGRDLADILMEHIELLHSCDTSKISSHDLEVLKDTHPQINW